MTHYLGLDYGEKRIGVAIADTLLSIATPHGMIPAVGRQKILAEIKKLITEFQVEKIVVGLPKTLKGEIGVQAQKITEEVNWLQTQINTPFVFWDERLSTSEVNRLLSEADVHHKRKKEIRDSLAAQRILQNFLDFNRNHS